MKALATPLTKSEAEQFQNLDATIRDGAKTFMAVGKALVQMHEGKLYREKFQTFEEYAASVGLKRSNAYKLMGAVKTTLEIENVHNCGHDETQQNQGDREKVSGFASVNAMSKLTKFPKKKRDEILAAAKATGKITAASIEAAAATVMHTPQPEKPAALKGVDITKLNQPETKWPDPSDPANQAPVQPATMSGGPLTPRQFESAIKALEQKAEAAAAGNQKERDKYGVILNAAAGRLLNPPKAEYNPYGR